MFKYCTTLYSTMVADQSIKVSEEAKEFLDSLKIVDRETYDDVILKLKKELKERKK